MLFYQRHKGTLDVTNVSKLLFPRWSRLAQAAPQEMALRITAQAAVAAESQEEQTTKQSIEAYFPEGTWCHRDTRQIDYYCQNRECKP